MREVRERERGNERANRRVKDKELLEKRERGNIIPPRTSAVIRSELLNYFLNPRLNKPPTPKIFSRPCFLLLLVNYTSIYSNETE